MLYQGSYIPSVYMTLSLVTSEGLPVTPHSPLFMKVVVLLLSQLIQFLPWLTRHILYLGTQISLPVWNDCSNVRSTIFCAELCGSSLFPHTTFQKGWVVVFFLSLPIAMGQLHSRKDTFRLRARSSFDFSDCTLSRDCSTLQTNKPSSWEVPCGGFPFLG